MYKINSSDYHTLRYVNWLEKLVEGVQTQSGEAPNQQLKAEIAACVTELDCIQEACGRDELVQKVINRMRQLSAV